MLGIKEDLYWEQWQDSLECAGSNLGVPRSRLNDRHLGNRLRSGSVSAAILFHQSPSAFHRHPPFINSPSPGLIVHLPSPQCRSQCLAHRPPPRSSRTTRPRRRRRQQQAAAAASGHPRQNPARDPLATRAESPASASSSPSTSPCPQASYRRPSSRQPPRSVNSLRRIYRARKTRNGLGTPYHSRLLLKGTMRGASLLGGVNQISLGRKGVEEKAATAGEMIYSA
ncbi:hypothetical protein OE88DRAFT_1026029 [Heliocybe sulcata]|uniref:Uncharacterized protein n=1 Tax=Heliocybe sulcata TaxID=5364 RepID=A0A5C3NBR4_9AGAM|nr:hypothetical protein OE88DRAFT_1026029 [Heliocybe sulcata]